MVVSLQLVWWSQKCHYRLKKIKVLMITTSSMIIDWVWVIWERSKLRISNVQELHYRINGLSNLEYCRWRQVWLYLGRFVRMNSNWIEKWLRVWDWSRGWRRRLIMTAKLEEKVRSWSSWRWFSLGKRQM